MCIRIHRREKKASGVLLTVCRKYRSLKESVYIEGAFLKHIKIVLENAPSVVDTNFKSVV